MQVWSNRNGSNLQRRDLISELFSFLDNSSKFTAMIDSTIGKNTRHSHVSIQETTLRITYSEKHNARETLSTEILIVLFGWTRFPQHLATIYGANKETESSYFTECAHHCAISGSVHGKRTRVLYFEQISREAYDIIGLKELTPIPRVLATELYELPPDRIKYAEILISARTAFRSVVS